MRNRRIEITMNEHRMQVLEKVFFKTVTKKEYEEMKPAIFVIWREVCEQFGKKEKKNE